MQERNVNHANKLTPNNPIGGRVKPRLRRLGRRPVENSQSMSELQAKIEMQKNKRRNQTKLRSSPLLVYPTTESQRFLRQSSKPQPILN